MNKKKVIVIISSLTIVTLSSIAIFTKNPKAEVDIESSGTLDSLTETLSGTQIKGYVKNKKPELMYVSKDSIKLFVNEDMKVYNKMASADDKLEVLGKDEDKGYYKIKTDDGREFFVKTDDLTDKVPESEITTETVDLIEETTVAETQEVDETEEQKPVEQPTPAPQPAPQPEPAPAPVPEPAPTNIAYGTISYTRPTEDCEGWVFVMGSAVWDEANGYWYGNYMTDNQESADIFDELNSYPDRKGDYDNEQVSFTTTWIYLRK